MKDRRMQISVILAHPNPESLNHAIYRVVLETLEAAGHTVKAHDLYGENFDPLMRTAELGPPDLDAMSPEIRAHRDELHAADGFVIVHPNWFRQPPAILTGWIDRVIRSGDAFKFVDGKPVGQLKAKRALVINTANNPQEKEVAIFGDPLDGLWKKCIFGVCGVEDVRRLVFSPVILSTPEQRAGWLEEARKTVQEVFPA